MSTHTFPELSQYLLSLGAEPTRVKAVTPELKTLELEPGDVLLYQGETQKYAYWIASGMLKACYFSTSGVERCKEYYFPGELCFLYSPWLTQTPANYQIEALKTATVVRFPLGVLATEPWHRVKSNLLEQQLLYKEEKEEFLLLKSPEQRYLHMLEHTKTWLQNLSDGQLAAYIGISPISLSRIKRRLK